MKKQLLFPVVLMIATLMFSSFSGGKCKFDYEKKDEFTGKAVRWSKWRFINIDNSYSNGVLSEFQFQVGDNSGQFNITNVIVLGGELKIMMTESDTTLIKLKDGNIIKLAPKGEFSPSTTVNYTNMVVTEYKPIFNISKAKMQKLSESPIVAIKLKIGDKEFNIKPIEGKAAKAMEMAACLLSEGGE